MSKFRAWLWSTVMLVALCAFGSVVFADDAPADPATNPTGALQQFWNAVVGKRWGIAATVGTMLLVALVRFVAPRLHDKFGDWILTSRVSATLALISGMLSSVATQLMKGGAWSVNMIAYGFGFGVMAIGGYNAFWDLIFPNDKKPSSKMAIPPPPVRAGILLPLAFIVFGAPLSSCAHTTPSEKAFGDAYAACMTTKGLTAAPNVAQEVWNDLNNGADSAAIVAQLEALAKKIGSDAVACAVQAWMTPTPGTPAAKNPAGVEAANTYLKNHSSTTARSNRHAALSPPRGCGPWFGALGA